MNLPTKEDALLKADEFAKEYYLNHGNGLRDAFMACWKWLKTIEDKEHVDILNEALIETTEALNYLNLIKHNSCINCFYGKVYNCPICMTCDREYSNWKEKQL